MLKRTSSIIRSKQFRVKPVLAFLLLFSFSLTGFTLFSSPVYADEEKPAMRIQISPVENRVTLNANETNEYTFNIDNTGSEGYSFKVYANPYSVLNEQYSPSFSNQNSHTQVSRWITFKNDNGEYSTEATY